MRELTVAAGLLAAACGFQVDGSGESSSDGSSTTTGATTGTSVTTQSGSETSTSSSGGGSTSTAGTSGAETGTTDALTSGGGTGSSSGVGTGTGGATTTTSGTGSTGAPADCHPMIAEVLPGLSGADDGREWVVLYNNCPEAIILDGYAIGWGGDALSGANDLTGTIDAGGCFVVGGPTTDAGNFDPVYDQTAQFGPQLTRAQGGVLLHQAAAGAVNIATVPVDALIYGTANVAGFLDSTGVVGAIAIAGQLSDISLRRTGASTWIAGNPPTPNACPSF